MQSKKVYEICIIDKKVKKKSMMKIFRNKDKNAKCKEMHMYMYRTYMKIH